MYNTYGTVDISKLGVPIWEQLFFTSISYKDSLSADDIKTFGMPTTGDNDIDADMHNQLVDRYLTINQMVELFKKGIVVHIKRHSDTKEMYDIISNYLNGWKTNLTNGINIGGAPIEDLVTLDRFANAVYEHATQHFTQEFVDSSLLMHFGRRSIGRNSFNPVEAKEEDNFKDKPRESLASVFSERVFNVRGGLWR